MASLEVPRPVWKYAPNLEVPRGGSGCKQWRYKCPTPSLTPICLQLPTRLPPKTMAPRCAWMHPFALPSCARMHPFALPGSAQMEVMDPHKPFPLLTTPLQPFPIITTSFQPSKTHTPNLVDATAMHCGFGNIAIPLEQPPK